VDAAYEMRTPEGNAFTGELKGRKRCVKNRRVTIIRSGGGPIGSVRSSQSGVFEMIVPGIEDGGYFAKAKKRVRRSDGHKHKCRSGRSPVIAVAGSCAELVLSGGPNPTDTLSVDDDVFVGLDFATRLDDNDEFATDNPPVVLGATTGGEEIQVAAANSLNFGVGPVSIDPLWIHCPARDVSFALDPEGFAGTDGPGEIFYNRSFVVPDMVPQASVSVAGK
jgi:hypothetical protein